jgi:hypothetical protein
MEESTCAQHMRDSIADHPIVLRVQFAQEPPDVSLRSRNEILILLDGEL